MSFFSFSDVVAVWDRCSNSVKANKKKKEDEKSISNKIINVCELHGIKKQQIPIVFNSISYDDLKSIDKFEQKITYDFLEEVSFKLGVKIEFLENSDDTYVYQTYDFYKSPKRFQEFLVKIKSNPDSFLRSSLLNSNKEQNGEINTALILEEEFNVSHVTYYKYYICNNFSLSYWKSRCYLTSCLYVCYLNNLVPLGFSIENNEMEMISEGRKILDLESITDANMMTKWFAEDLFNKPSFFLETLREPYEIEQSFVLLSNLESQKMIPSSLINNSDLFKI